MGCSSAKVVVDFSDFADDEKPFHQKYVLGHCLGKGSHGSVFLARHQDSGDECAVKVLTLMGYGVGEDSLRRTQAFWNEQTAWQRAGRHPNICCLQESFMDCNLGYLVMERCPSSLLSAWKSERDLNEHTYAKYFADISSALVHIHCHGIVHRDVKHDNLLMGGPSGQSVKLCDFGLSALLSDSSALTVKERGTAPYMAPEMLKSAAPCGTACDVWSFGVIVYMAFFGCWPYMPIELTPKAMKKAIRSGTQPPSFRPAACLPQGAVSDEAIEFVQALLIRNPKKRPSCSHASKMAYFLDRDSRASQVDASEVAEISLSRMLDCAVECGAFSVNESSADPNLSLVLKTRQRAAQRRLAERKKISNKIEGTPPNDLASQSGRRDECVTLHPFAAP